jgi:hypothetical protein
MDDVQSYSVTVGNLSIALICSMVVYGTYNTPRKMVTHALHQALEEFNVLGGGM